ncbi:c-type cytochrome biogenesis protein CcsB [Catellatospora bangladeshensis]|uniref:C-type cytochrome biogenesis protein CcsB n=1 Tax=Catellatospora bangladeshensis TaxID=310355 RepID=A0A8J3JSH5_9ACTN|nr:c-type cytochrome biogenesis protein CcsB [Catellatospora bangladeshensis]GIF82374.1 c-type cytochrome biogenesis protein CcsB [Catellatospora bangladeshensis]
MAALSDNLMVCTVLVYLVAMLLHAAEYAFGDRGRIGSAATAPAAEREKELVGAGAPVVAKSSHGGYAAPDVIESGGDRPSWASRLGFLAVVATVLGALAHLGSVVTRGLAAERLPFGNMYEFVMAITLLGVVVWLVTVLLQQQVRHVGLFVMLFEVLLVGVAGMVLYTPVGPLVPALDSYWFAIHIGAVATSSSLFMIGGAASIMFLVRAGYDRGKRGFLYAFGGRLANAEAVERLSFRLHAFAFPIWTFGVTAGAIWAEVAWGRYWGWDPKEVWAFISWVVYAGYLHARATPSIKRTTAAWIAVIGFLTMLMNLFGVNIFFTGLHSYGGV